MTAHARDLDRHIGKYYGKYAGTVRRIDDQDQLGSIWVIVPSMFGETNEVKARACLPFGHFYVPDIGTQVWIEFEGGNPAYPLWVGTWYAPGTTPQTSRVTPPEVRMIETPGGHTIELHDKSGEEKIVIKHPKNSFVSIDKDGSVIISNDKGSFLHLDSVDEKATMMQQDGNLLTMSSDGTLLVNNNGVVFELKGDNVRIMAAGNVQISAAGVLLQGQTVGIGEGAMERAVLGDMFMNNYFAHTHATAVGPSGPPLPPLPPAIPATPHPCLAQVTKVK
jgi:hypothetical protein